MSAAPAGSVSAAGPGAIAEVLEFAGYKAIIETDDLGDPMIKTELGGWPTTIYFYGCDETTHQGCDALRLEAGFDRATPWNGDESMKIAEKFRFAAVYLDKEGRSEEHTSELQSLMRLSYAVFCLKKKT